MLIMRFHFLCTFQRSVTYKCNSVIVDLNLAAVRKGIQSQARVRSRANEIWRERCSYIHRSGKGHDVTLSKG